MYCGFMYCNCLYIEDYNSETSQIHLNIVNFFPFSLDPGHKVKCTENPCLYWIIR